MTSAVALLCGATAAACQSNGSVAVRNGDGPLQLGSSETVLCVSSRTGATMGHRRLVNEGGDSVELTAVQLVEPRNLRLVDAFLIPPTADGVVHTGVQAQYPPRPPFTNRWRDRQSAIGTTVEPGSEWGFTVGLELTGRQGRADAVRVLYRDGDGDEYEVLYRTAIRIKSECPGT